MIMGEIIFKKVHEDFRGTLYIIEFKNKKILLITSNKGAPRGGHYHNNDQSHLIISGKFLVKTKDMKTHKTKRMKASPGDLIKIKAGVAHLLTALEDGIFLEIKGDEEETTTDYRPWRKIVEDFLEKQKTR